MKTIHVLLLAVGIMCSTSAMADEASEVAAAKLLDSMDMQSVLDQVIDAALDREIAKQPQFGPYKGVMHSFFAKYMSYAALKPQIIAAYAAELSASELSEAAQFYSTPAGKKILSKLPALMTKGAEIVQHAVKDHLPEFQQAIQDEAKRIQQLQQADKKG